jgi:EmrB/QacA subfamily drug resistance transporter
VSDLSRRDRIYTLIGILLAMFLGAIDQTIVATALPRIVEDLNGLDRYAWVITAYLVASTVLVPVYGKLADMYSRKAIELAAVGVFLLGSFLCGLAGEFGSLPILGDGMTQLIVFRAIQGLGGAGLMGMAFIIIADLFPPAERGKYQGLVGAVFGVSSVLGPLLGGFLTDYGGSIIPGIEGWRWVFYVNVPFGALALWFIITRMPPLLPSGDRGRLDYLATALLIVGLVPLILALQLDRTVYPWTAPRTLGMLVIALVALTLFVLRSLRSRNPILDFRLFGNRVFTTANVAGFFLGAAFMSAISFLPLFMINVVGVSATSAGLSMVPLTLGLVFGSVVSGQLVSRFGHYRRWMLTGGVILFLGILLLSRMGPDISYWQVTLYMVITGLGVGPSMPLYTLAVQNAVDVRKLGQATSASQFFRQIGGAIGIAVLGTVLATNLFSSLSANVPEGLAVGDPGSVGGEAGIAASGGIDIEARVREAIGEQYQAIASAVRAGDEAELDRILAASPIPSESRQGILTQFRQTDDPLARNAMLAVLRAGFEQRAAEVTAQAERGLRLAFTDAITRVYFYVLFVVAMGWLVTLFVPELPLSRTIGRPQPAPAD